MSHVHTRVRVFPPLFPAHFPSLFNRQDDGYSPALFSSRSREEMASEEEEEEEGEEEEGRKERKGMDEERMKTQELRWGGYLINSSA